MSLAITSAARRVLVCPMSGQVMQLPALLTGYELLRWARTAGSDAQMDACSTQHKPELGGKWPK